MPESWEELRKRLENEYRARIVRKLRAEADRIEAGGAIQCYSVSDEVEVELCAITEARDAMRVELEGYRDAWPDAVELQEWGVCVTVEEVVRTAHRADLRGSFLEIVNYALMDPDDAPEPEVLEQECPRCGHEVRVPPGGSCPVCESSGGGDE